MLPAEERRMKEVVLLYNKIQDKIMFLGMNAILKMNVVLYTGGFMDPNKGKKYYYGEVKYTDDEGINRKKINRTFDAFLTIENIKQTEGGNKESVIIRGAQLELMRLTLLPKLEKMILEPETIFESRNNKLYVKEAPATTIECSNNKFLVFAPGIHKLYNEDLQPCLDMYLNNEMNINSMSFNTVLQLINFIRTFSIYQYACTMVNFLPRPVPGYNMYDMSLSNEQPSYFDTNSHSNKRMR